MCRMRTHEAHGLCAACNMARMRTQNYPLALHEDAETPTMECQRCLRQEPQKSRQSDKRLSKAFSEVWKNLYHLGMCKKNQKCFAILQPYLKRLEEHGEGLEIKNLVTLPRPFMYHDTDEQQPRHVKERTDTAKKPRRSGFHW